MWRKVCTYKLFILLIIVSVVCFVFFPTTCKNCNSQSNCNLNFFERNWIKRLLNLKKLQKRKKRFLIWIKKWISSGAWTYEGNCFLATQTRTHLLWSGLYEIVFTKQLTIRIRYTKKNFSLFQKCYSGISRKVIFKNW